MEICRLGLLEGFPLKKQRIKETQTSLQQRQLTIEARLCREVF
jgi:hypothetical protein